MQTTQRTGNCIHPYIRRIDRSPDILSQLTDVDRGNMVGIMLKAAIDIGIIYLKRFMVNKRW